jgi:hypothetical protein
MPHVILQPSGGTAAREHYQDTIRTPVPLDLIAQYVEPSDFALLAEMFPERAVPTWGVVPGDNGRNVDRWERVANGDILLFAGQGAVRATGVVRHKLRNRELALRLWSTDEDGETWEYIYFVDQITECEIPYAAFNAAAGYAAKNVIQGFEVLDDVRSAAILSVLDLGMGAEALPGSEEDLVAAANLDPATPLDAVGQTLIRKEQGFLRRQLFGRRRYDRCCVCGSELPTDLLVAAHIKKRSLCSHAERLDYRNNVVSMCKLGCDDLFEKGYIFVANGLVTQNVNRSNGTTVSLVAALERVVGRRCGFASTGAHAYFDWHRRFHENAD